nr:hypothetical protein [Tanacetum cinerariifolium]
PPKAKTKYKKKPVQATKGTRIKSKTKVTKSDKKKQPAKKTKAKSGLGDGVNTQSKVPDEQQQQTFGIDKGTGTILRVLDVPPYEYESDKESWGDSEDKDDNDDESWGDSEDKDDNDDGKSNDHDDDSDNQRTESDNDEISNPNLTNVDQTEYEEDVDERARTPSDYELTNKEKLDDEESMDNEEDDEVIKELYNDVNVNLGNDENEITDANQGDNEIASLMETSAPHATIILEITSSFTTTTHPPPPFFNPLLQQQTSTITTPTFTTITFTNPTVTLPEIPNFASVFKFDQRYLASKMKEVVNVAIQLQTNKLREEAQAENQEFLNQADSTMKTIIRIKLNPKHATRLRVRHGDNNEQPVDKEVTKADWFKKPERPLTLDPDRSKRHLEYLKGGDSSRRYSTFVTKKKAATYDLKWIKDLVPKLCSPMVVKYDQHAYFSTSHWGPKCQSFYGYASNLTSSKDVYSRIRIITVTGLTIMKKYGYGYLEEIEVLRDDQQLYTFKEGYFEKLCPQDIEDMLLLLVQQKLTNLTIVERDGTLNDVWTALHDIAAGIRIVPMRKWSNLDKKGLRPYEEDLQLLERTI